MSIPDWHQLAEVIGRPVDGVRPVRGGDINAAWRVDSGDDRLFVKSTTADKLAMFEAEAEGLEEIAASGTIRVPEVIASGQTDDNAFLALEWLDFEAPTTAVETALGERLAAMHAHTADRFGWHRDNTIGLTPQVNSRHDDWIQFFRRHRLDFQLDLAARNGYGGDVQSLGRQLADNLDKLFEGDEPEPSLLHGDLWSGNWAATDGEPVIFDPAVYYGDRESDIAMTRLFGGFGRAFYDAYDASVRQTNGSRSNRGDEREALYQLYHLLNHLNLFGSGYLGSVTGKLRALCAGL
ncbi:MAG: fructosamine kinase family protein [Woeseiaceae bacterium]|nr:fructosamine kinase family protein [Woeseiaceae bacterium]